MEAQSCERLGHAVFEHLLQLVPGSAGRGLHFLRFRERRFTGCVRSTGGCALRPRFEILALLHERVEHLPAFLLTAEKGAEPRKPDLRDELSTDCDIGLTVSSPP